MLEVDHYRFQADRARRMADRVSDTLLREKLLEMASEFGRYAALIEAKAREKLTQTVPAQVPGSRSPRLSIPSPCFRQTRLDFCNRAGRTQAWGF